MGIEKAWSLLTAKLLGWMREFILLLPNLAVAVAVLVGFWLLAKLARNVLARLLRRISHSEQVNKLLGQAIYLALIAAGFFVALGILDLQKTLASLLAGAGILGLALGFAFQDIAANFMAGIYLSIEHPFRPGHLIRSKDIQGVVQRIRLRWTEIVAPEGQLLLVPNKQVFENPITNFTTAGKRRVDPQGGSRLRRRPRDRAQGGDRGDRAGLDADAEHPGRALFRGVRGELDPTRSALLDPLRRQAGGLPARQERGDRAPQARLRREWDHDAVPDPHDRVCGAGAGRGGADRGGGFVKPFSVRAAVRSAWRV